MSLNSNIYIVIILLNRWCKQNGCYTWSQNMPVVGRFLVSIPLFKLIWALLTYCLIITRKW